MKHANFQILWKRLKFYLYTRKKIPWIRRTIGLLAFYQQFLKYLSTACTTSYLRSWIIILIHFLLLFGCQSTLLRLLEDWRKALDNHECVAAILMDLSKAFDCLPHGLLIAKLRAYGLSEEAVELLESYLSDRSQQVRLGTFTSTWEKLFKGVPQGSILGPLLFNIFLNDIFYFVLRSTIYNYDDDNTVSFIHEDFNFLKSVLESDSLNLISWFEENSMKANPDKFQAICIGKKTYDNIETFRIGETDIKCENNVSLLGINIDFMLKFDDHVTEICKKASKQLAVLNRLGRFLAKQGKLVILTLLYHQILVIAP